MQVARKCIPSQSASYASYSEVESTALYVAAQGRDYPASMYADKSGRLSVHFWFPKFAGQ
jgi:hypothetical protein